MRKIIIVFALLIGLYSIGFTENVKQGNYEHLKAQIESLDRTQLKPDEELKIQYKLISAYTNEQITEFALNILIRKLYKGESRDNNIIATMFDCISQDSVAKTNDLTVEEMYELLSNQLQKIYNKLEKK